MYVCVCVVGAGNGVRKAYLLLTIYKHGYVRDKRGLIFSLSRTGWGSVSGKGFKYTCTCLGKGSCLSGKGVVNDLSLEWGYHRLILLMI